MVAVENNIIKEVEKLKWLRMLVILLSFMAGIVLTHLGQVRAAIFTVGAVIILCGIGYFFLKKAAIRSISAKTGKTMAQLAQELQNKRAAFHPKGTR